MMGPMHLGDMETLVFAGWMTRSPGTMFGACIAVILISLARHFILAWRGRVAAYVGAAASSSGELLAQGSSREVRDPLRACARLLLHRRAACRALSHVPPQPPQPSRS